MAKMIEMTPALLSRERNVGRSPGEHLAPDRSARLLNRHAALPLVEEDDRDDDYDCDGDVEQQVEQRFGALAGRRVRSRSN